MLFVDCGMSWYIRRKHSRWSLACWLIQIWFLRHPSWWNQSAVNTPSSSIALLLTAGLKLMPQRFKVRSEFCSNVVIELLAYLRGSVFITSIAPHDHTCCTHISCLANCIVQINLKWQSVGRKISTKWRFWLICSSKLHLTVRMKELQALIQDFVKGELRKLVLKAPRHSRGGQASLEHSWQ